MAGLLGIIEQNTWFTEEARTFLAYLILKGEISDIDIGDESEVSVQSAINELAFDCTKLILKKHKEIKDSISKNEKPKIESSSDIKKKQIKCPYCYLDLENTKENPLI